ncbi:hypothetical protein DUT91_06720 [Phyllobacterium salinisoli]|uniref:Uncharacterized protein n=2 Tax=Phyllobacterium salinisoli TaxID=1899321 RepID=A0A368K7D6_9HYPH|nr:hypothetical protein DUT91_06720 [Phyllobacterium salinisoli]
MAAENKTSDPDQPNPNESGQVPQDCRADPQAGQGNTKPETQESMAKRLERCKGVLKPPPTGDSQTDLPPPDTGKTPIIPPGAIPGQPAK